MARICKHGLNAKVCGHCISEKREKAKRRPPRRTTKLHRINPAKAAKKLGLDPAAKDTVSKENCERCGKLFLSAYLKKHKATCRRVSGGINASPDTESSALKKTQLSEKCEYCSRVFFLRPEIFLKHVKKCKRNVGTTTTLSGG